MYLSHAHEKGCFPSQILRFSCCSKKKRKKKDKDEGKGERKVFIYFWEKENMWLLVFMDGG